MAVEAGGEEDEVVEGEGEGVGGPQRRGGEGVVGEYVVDGVRGGGWFIACHECGSRCCGAAETGVSSRLGLEQVALYLAGDAAGLWDQWREVHDEEGRPFAADEEDEPKGGEPEHVFLAAADDLDLGARERDFALGGVGGMRLAAQSACQL